MNENELKVFLRIACPEAGYPISEARYVDIVDYEEQTGYSFQALLSQVNF